MLEKVVVVVWPPTVRENKLIGDPWQMVCVSVAGVNVFVNEASGVVGVGLIAKIFVAALSHPPEGGSRLGSKALYDIVTVPVAVADAVIVAVVLVRLVMVMSGLFLDQVTLDRVPMPPEICKFRELFWQMPVKPGVGTVFMIPTSGTRLTLIGTLTMQPVLND